MNKKIIASVLAVAFAFSMVNSVRAVTLEELQTLYNELLTKYELLLAQVGQQIPGAAAVCFYTDLQYGMTSAEVSKLQTQLKLDPAVYPEGLVTGYFGPLTFKAAKAFQAKHGIITTGYVGLLTQAKLNAMYCTPRITSQCTDGSSCMWNGSKCVKILGVPGEMISQTQLPLIQPDCICVDNNCTAQYVTPPTTTTITVPPTTTKYSCNISTRQCYADANGSFTSLSTCQNICPIMDPVPTTITVPPTTTTTICPSPLVEISAYPNPVPYKGAVVLSWTSNNANYCFASASPSNYQWSDQVDSNGNKTISNFSQTTTFYITCTNNCGLTSRNIVVRLSMLNL